MSQLDVLKLLQRYGEETDLADFSPDELEELLREMENGDEPLPENFAAFKQRYFGFYDDVKDKSLKNQDW